MKAPSGTEESDERGERRNRRRPSRRPPRRRCHSSPSPTEHDEPEEEEDAAGARGLPARETRAPARRGSRAAAATSRCLPTTILDELKLRRDVDNDAPLRAGPRPCRRKSGEFGVLGNVVEIHPGPRGHHLRVQARRGHQVLEDRRPRRRPRPRPGGGVASASTASAAAAPWASRSRTRSARPSTCARSWSPRPSARRSGRLTLALGKTVSGETYVTDLAAMPHLLIAGSTGTGKSVGLNCMIASILYSSTPDEVRMILIDPKRLELGRLRGHPPPAHARWSPTPRSPPTSSSGRSAEMEKRIRKLASEGVRNIEQFNNIIRAEKGGSGPARARRSSSPSTTS